MSHTSSKEVTFSKLSEGPVGAPWHYQLKSGVQIRGAHIHYARDVDRSAHTPPQVTFVFLLAGQMTLILRRRKYVLSAGKYGRCIMISSQHAEVIRRLANSGDCNQHIVVNGMERWLSDYVGSDLEINGLYDERLRSWPMSLEMEELCQKWQQQSNHHDPLQREVLGLALMNSAWQFFIKQQHCVVTVNGHDAKALELAQSLQRQMRQGVFDGQSLADGLNLSLRTLQRRMGQVFGCTLKEWITQQRLELAKQALLKQGASLTQASQLAGYQHNSSFIVAFRKAFNVTPKVFLTQQKRLS